MQPASEKQPPIPPWDAVTPTEGGAGGDGHGLIQRIKSRVMRLAPRPVVKLLANPYIAGEKRHQAIELARGLHERNGISSTLDVLGESIHDPHESRAMLAEYIGVLDDLGQVPYANISIKLSALGQLLDEELCAENLDKLLSHAEKYDQFVRFDMEDHTTTDSTLGFYRRFVQRYPKIGPVLQSRLHRTVKDVEALAPYKPNVRLCLGIYREPASIALQDKPAMKQRLLELLEVMWGNGQYVAIATHDETVLRRALALAGRMGKTAADFEVQMLLGVPRAPIQREILEEGIRVRLYVPYGDHWYQYCLRRLENNPEMARMVLGNLFQFRQRMQ